MDATATQLEMVSNEIAYCEKVMNDNEFAVGVWPMGSREAWAEYETARYKYAEANTRLNYLRGLHEHLGAVLLFKSTESTPRPT